MIEAAGLPPDVGLVLDALLPAIRGVLRTNLVGVYLRGSLAEGNFDPHTSDIDLLAVTQRRVSDAEFAELAALHERLAALPHRYAHEVEIVYLDHAAARRFTPDLRHPTLGRGETLAWAEHRDNWVLERWTLREHGMALLGPEPDTLIDPVSPEEIVAAVRARLRDWAACADEPEDPGWLRPRRGYLAFVLETMCRALATLAAGAPRSKRRGVAWALQTLPPRWRRTVNVSRAWRSDPALDPASVPEVIAFVRWATSDGAAMFDRPQAWGGGARDSGAGLAGRPSAWPKRRSGGTGLGSNR